MAISIPATIAGNSGATNSNTFVINLPAEAQVAGRLVLIAWGQDNSSGNGEPTVTTPASGWNVENQNANTLLRFAIIWRLTDGSEGSSITVTLANSASEMASWGGYVIVDGDLVAPTIATAVTVASSSAPNPPTVSAPGGSAECLYIAACAWDNNRTISSYPTDYTLSQLSEKVAVSQGAGMAIAARLLTAASDDPSAFAYSSVSANSTTTIVIEPASVVNAWDGEGDLALPGLAAVGEGQFDEPVYDGSGDLALPGVELEVDGSFALPTYDGTSDVDISGLTITVEGSFDVPAYDGSAELAISGLGVEAEGATTIPEYDGSADLDISGLQLEAEGSFALPTYDGTSDVDIAGLTITVEGSFDVPAYDGSAELGLSGTELVFEAAIDNPSAEYEGSADVIISGLGIDADGENTGAPPEAEEYHGSFTECQAWETFSGEQFLTLDDEPLELNICGILVPALEMEISGTMAVPVYDGSADVAIAGLELQADADAAVPTYEGLADVALSGLEWIVEGAIDNPIHEGTSEIAVSGLGINADGEIAVPEYDGLADVAIAGLGLEAGGELTLPAYDGSADLGLSGSEIIGEALIDNPETEHLGSASLDVSGLQATISGIVDNPLYEGVATLSLSGARVASAGLSGAPLETPSAGICTAGVSANVDTGVLTAGVCTASLVANYGE